MIISSQSCGRGNFFFLGLAGRNNVSQVASIPLTINYSPQGGCFFVKTARAKFAIRLLSSSLALINKQKYTGVNRNKKNLSRSFTNIYISSIAIWVKN